MFLQHTVSSTPQANKVSNSNPDFELFILSKHKEQLQGKIVFQYLHQSFEATIFISASSIQINSSYPFAGITAAAPLLQNNPSQEEAYLLNGSLTKNGHQNIVWLMLDFIHLYNLLRLKPNSILELYRETFAFVKIKNEQIAFGHIPLNGTIAKLAGNFLASKMKLKHKYIFNNPIHLLSSVQLILASYPQQFLMPKLVLNKLDSVLSQ